jgi:amidophosphoribosyltransferase
VGYLSLESLRTAVGDKDEEFCTSCYTGNYPTELVQLETAAHRDG